MDKLFFFSLLVSIVLPAQAFSQVEGIKYQWKKTVDKEGVQVFSSRVSDSKFRAVRAQMMVKGDVKSFVALLEDTENCSSWASLCKELSLVKEVARDEYYVYILNEVIFPVADRDLVAKITWHRNRETGKLTMNSQAVSSYQNLPKKKGVVRIHKALTQWHFTPKSDGYVFVESFAHIDPNGSVPAWIVNHMSRTAPFRSMKKVKTIIESGKYNAASVNLPESYF